MCLLVNATRICSSSFTQPSASTIHPPPACPVSLTHRPFLFARFPFPATRHPPPSPAMKVSIQTLANKKYVLEVDEKDTVLTLKNRIHSELSLGEVDEQKVRGQATAAAERQQAAIGDFSLHSVCGRRDPDGADGLHCPRRDGR